MVIPLLLTFIGQLSTRHHQVAGCPASPAAVSTGGLAKFGIRSALGHGDPPGQGAPRASGDRF